jgi:hypothetical protein
MRVPFPRPSAETGRRFVFEIVTITAGILIALWIDGVRETRRDATLVREAHAAIALEIADNLKDLEGTLPSMAALQKTLEGSLQIAEDLLTKGVSTGVRTRIAVSFPSLNRASWDTATRTGALGLMDWADAKRYSEMYALQDLVDQSQRRYVDRLAGEAASLFLVVAPESTVKPRPQDLENARTQAIGLLMASGIHQSLATQLAAEYKKAARP